MTAGLVLLCYAIFLAWFWVQSLVQSTVVVNDIQYRSNGDLKQVRKPTDEQLMWIFMYAEDIALLASSKAAIELLDAVVCD